MTYSVKEIFYSLQGEGHHTGRPAVFCRFAGCNFWSGREADRAQADCSFCDTDFIGTDGQNGGKFSTADSLADTARKIWRGAGGKPFIVCTGGEPLMQLDRPLITAFQDRGFEVAVETNGSLPCPPELDWICVSPKNPDKLVQVTGDELKLVYPQMPSARMMSLIWDLIISISSPVTKTAQQRPTRRPPSPIVLPTRSGNSACKAIRFWAWIDGLI